MAWQVSNGASEDAERAWLPRYLRSQAERGTAGERSFASLGQNKRPREKFDKTGPAKLLPLSIEASLTFYLTKGLISVKIPSTTLIPLK